MLHLCLYTTDQESGDQTGTFSLGSNGLGPSRALGKSASLPSNAISVYDLMAGGETGHRPQRGATVTWAQLESSTQHYCSDAMFYVKGPSVS